jgi:hypothetical protein
MSPHHVSDSRNRSFTVWLDRDDDDVVVVVVLVAVAVVVVIIIAVVVDGSTQRDRYRQQTS